MDPHTLHRDFSGRCGSPVVTMRFEHASAHSRLQGHLYAISAGPELFIRIQQRAAAIPLQDWAEYEGKLTPPLSPRRHLPSLMLRVVFGQLLLQIEIPSPKQEFLMVGLVSLLGLVSGKLETLKYVQDTFRGFPCRP